MEQRLLLILIKCLWEYVRLIMIDICVAGVGVEDAKGLQISTIDNISCTCACVLVCLCIGCLLKP